MNKKPIYKRVTALVTAACTVAVMCGLPAFAFAADTGVTKEETVYIVTDSTGTQQDVIVSDHLQNKGKVKTIADETNLSDIENVKGEETFKQNGDALTWDAEGNSIYYQGKSENEVPVAMDVVYRLDGKVVSGSELQGQSGRVEIKINYQNDAEYEGTTVPFIVMTGIVITDDSFRNIKIDHGKVIDDGDKLLVVGMAAPGLAQTLDIGETDLGIGSSVTITGDADKFAVEDMMTVVTNSVFEDVDTDKLDDLDYDDEIKELDKGAKALADGSDALYEGLNKLDESMPDLQDGVGQLNDGSKELAKGTKEAKKGAKQLNSGIVQLGDSITEALNKVLEGVIRLASGSKSLHDNLVIVKAGVDKAKGGADSVKNGMGQTAESLTNKGIAANNGAKQAIAGAEQNIQGVVDTLAALHAAGRLSDDEYNGMKNALLQGADPAHPGATALLTRADELVGSSTLVDQGVVHQLTETKTEEEEKPTMFDGVDAVSGGLGNLSTGLGDDTTDNTLIKGAKDINNGLDQMQDSISENLDSKGKLNKGLKKLKKGSSDLAKGEVKLASGSQQLSDGMTKLNDSADTLADGVDKLDNGAEKLSKGMSELYKQGIKKIVDLYNDDLKGTLDSADAMFDAGKGYKTFTRLPSGMDGSVKFIYKTDMTD